MGLKENNRSTSLKINFNFRLQASVDLPVPPTVGLNRSGLAFDAEFRVRVLIGGDGSNISFTMVSVTSF